MGPMTDEEREPPRDPSLPRRIGRYEVIRLLGRGGMGAVYEAEQKNPVRRVAIKVVHADFAHPELLRRFEVEGQLLGRLQHPGIAQIYEADTFESGQGTRPFFAMEYVQGRSLLDYAAQQELGTRARLELFARTCDALQHAHLRGVIHRDLKPGNILVDESGQPKVLDFGIARATDGDVQTTTLRTDVGQLLGTLAYMSPEQASGDPSLIDVRSDVYSLGVVLYQLLTNRLPYAVQGKVVHEAVRIVREEEPTPLSSVDPFLRGDVETIVGKALAKDVEHRYGSAAELASDLRRYLADEPIAARAPSAAYQLRKFVRRNKVLVGGVVAVFFVLALGLVGTGWGLLRAQEGEDQALAAQRAETRLRAEAQASEERAREEARRATLVADFTQGILGSVDPEVAQDADTTLLQRMLDDAAARIEGELEGSPSAEASLRGVIGSTYSAIGDQNAAEPHLVRALELSEELYGPDDPRTLALRLDLGVLRSRQGRWPESIEILEDAVRRCERVLGPTDPRTISTHLSLASSRSDAERPEDAEPPLRALLEIPTLSDAERERVHNVLGLLLLQRGDYEEAEGMFAALVESYEARLGPKHPETIHVLANQSGLLSETGRTEEALRVDTDALARATEVLGPDHPDTITVRSNLGELMRKLARYPEATELLEGALESRRRVLGDDHPSTIVARRKLGSFYREVGRYDEAKALLEEAVASSERVLGPEHLDTLMAVDALALLAMRTGRASEAIPMLQRVVDRLTALRGERHPVTLSVLFNLGTAQIAAERTEDAMASLASVLEGRRAVKGDRHPDTLISLNTHAVALMNARRFAEADPLLREALAAQHDVIGPDHPDTLITAYNLGWVCHELGEHAEAATAYREAYEGWARIYGLEHELTLKGAGSLADELEEKGPSADAVDCRQTIVAASRARGAPLAQLGDELRRLGLDLIVAERWEEAEATLAEALELLDATFGPDDARTQEAGEALDRAVAARGGESGG